MKIEPLKILIRCFGETLLCSFCELSDISQSSNLDSPGFNETNSKKFYDCLQCPECEGNFGTTTYINVQKTEQEAEDKDLDYEVASNDSGIDMAGEALYSQAEVQDAAHGLGFSGPFHTNREVAEKVSMAIARLTVKKMINFDSMINME